MPGLVKSTIVSGFVMMMTLGAMAQQASGAGNAEAGGKVYQARCAPCHGPDGKAAIPTAQALNPKPRDHSDGAYMNQLSEEHMTKVVKNGGPAVGKSPIMPAHTDLNDQQIADVVAFMRTLAVPPYSKQ
ncbi:MAG: cytochrome c [Candidatus Tectomicrobia bacterium]|uniref:Cytochrome c n=1 Tax=Tectimicrobiota bacterium TaxID=2528274 RepID=A0A938B0R0_UNCTE|nr:cytochrome c [Candidatus Tectomicrobia bacterium]